jgi:transposase
MQIVSVGIDLGKTTFHLVALGAAGKVLVRKKFTQRQLLTFTANMQTSLIGMEACSGAHFLGRALRKQGHDVRLIAAQFVKPFVKSNKNDFVDAAAIAEAVERKNMRLVPIKTDDQLDLQAIHRVRDRLISRRTAVINQLRAFLLERGLVFAKTPAKLRVALPDILENAELDLTAQMRSLIDLLWKEWKTVEDQIKGLSSESERISDDDPGCTRIRQAVLRIKRDRAPSEPGLIRSMPAPRKTSSWSLWPISWPASHGRCFPAEKTTDQHGNLVTA